VDKTSKILMAAGIPIMIIGLVLLFNVFGLQDWLTFVGVPLTLVGAAMAWIGFARSRGIVG